MFLETCKKEETNHRVAFSEKIYFHPEQIERFSFDVKLFDLKDIKGRALKHIFFSKQFGAI